MKTYAKSIENRTNKTVLEAILIAALIAVTAVFGACDFFVTLTSITAEYVGGNVAVGANVNKTDITVTAFYSNDTSKTVTDFDISGFDSETAGLKVVTVSFTDNGTTKSTTVNVTVEASVAVVTLESIKAEYNGENIEINGTLNKSDIIVTAYYSDGLDKTVTDFEINGFDSSAAGTKRVTASKTTLPWPAKWKWRL